MRIRFAGETNIGLKRAHNEDSFFLPEADRLVIVADGMGGHASGEVASKMAVDTVAEHFRNTAEDAELTWPFKLDGADKYDANRLSTGIKLANLRIFDKAQRDEGCHGMGTTIVASLFLDDKVLIGHVGDSRVYRLRDGQLTQLTEDHSLLNDYIRMKRLSSEDVGKFPHKNVIVRALGMKESVQVDLLSDPTKLGDVYLLCSDGLTGMVDDPGLSYIISEEPDLDVACERLIHAANRNGGQDNITCCLARLEAL
ncbi:MAG TPA: Stp1/IreP family PP2C-type Ser/Thr phosphatase [Polyangia bacterium]|jgi:protein phosphatase|nr:Stp1/IreP family PP2C-type Ser/Thr phosphatase [Polyangia bacterium]